MLEDLDPGETREWIDALESVLAATVRNGPGSRWGSWPRRPGAAGCRTTRCTWATGTPGSATSITTTWSTPTSPAVILHNPTAEALRNRQEGQDHSGGAQVPVRSVTTRGGADDWLVRSGAGVADDRQVTHDPDVMTQEMPTARPRRGRWVVLAVVVAVVVLAAVALGVAAMLPVAEKVPAGTTVAGVAVGGMTRAQVRTALAGPVTAAVQQPIRLLLDDDETSVSPADAGIALDRDATETALLEDVPKSLLDRIRDRRSGAEVAPVLTVDQDKARSTVQEKLDEFTRTAKDATVDLPAPAPVLSDKGDTSFTARSAEATVVASRTGKKIDLTTAVAAVRSAVAGQRTEARLTVVTTQPRVSTEQAAGIDQLIGTFTTEHACCAPRVTNIHRIAELVDGSMIAPGATFSLNAASGRRTAENGFVSAPAIADGELVDQFGGGVSQFSTTLFNAAWFSGLTIPKHQPHSKYISRYPPGREATLDFDTIDQTIRNDTDTPVVIRTATTATSVTVALYGHTGDREVTSTTGARVPRDAGGFGITVKRTVRDDGSVLRTDTLNWTYTGLD